MKRLLFPICVLLVFSSCKKSGDNIIWEKSFATGSALFIKAMADSGILSCGEAEGKQYLLRLDKNRNKVTEYKSSDPGLLSSAWYADNCLIAAGSTQGKMILMRLDREGNILADTTFSTTYNIDRTTICYLGDGELLAVGSANPDSSDIGATGLFFVWFDTALTVSSHKEILETAFIAVNDLVTDNEGNIFIATTKRSGSLKPKAGAVKFNNLLQKLWETELYNNPSFGAASLDISLDNSGNVYVSGKTELSVSSGTVNNSFIASLTSGGGVRWKKYLEYANTGSSMRFDDSGQPMVLNMNCFIISILNPDDGSSTGIIRTYDVCDPANTDAFGLCMDQDWDGNILMAGAKGGGYYLVIKSSLALSAV